MRTSLFGATGQPFVASESASNKLMESFFQISNDSLRDVHSSMNNETQSSIPDAVRLGQSIGKRRKIDEEGQFVVSVSYENTAMPAKLMELPIVG